MNGLILRKRGSRKGLRCWIALVISSASDQCPFEAHRNPEKCYSQLCSECMLFPALLGVHAIPSNYISNAIPFQFGPPGERRAEA